jgi:hypothetical protein
LVLPADFFQFFEERQCQSLVASIVFPIVTVPICVGIDETSARVTSTEVIVQQILDAVIDLVDVDEVVVGYSGEHYYLNTETAGCRPPFPLPGIGPEGLGFMLALLLV